MSDSKKPVVLQILPALENGGVERGTIDLAKALKKENFEPIVASNGGILVYQLSEAKIKHIKLALHSKNPLTIFSNIEKLVKIIEENHVDILHARSRAPMISAYFACKKTGTKLVSTVHGTYSLKFLKWENFWLKRLYNSVMLKADAIIAVSEFIRDYLVKNYQEKNRPVPVEKITVIQRGADLGYFDCSKVSKNRIIDIISKWAVPEDKKIILMPARFTAWKGHEFLLDALARVRGDFFCVMVGSSHGHNKFRTKIEQKIVKENLAGRVKIVGVCKDMPVAYALSHFVICPSVRPEAFGRIAIEAQASNKIIIATKIGGSLETVIDGVTGFLVEPNDVNALASAIDAALEMPKPQVDLMGNAARKNIEENFSNTKMCAQTISVYKSLLNRR